MDRLGEEQIVVEVAIDVRFRCVADLGKVADHAVGIELNCLNGDRGLNGGP